MAYDSNELTFVGGSRLGGQQNRWMYRTTDPITTVCGSGYFSDAVARQMKDGDDVRVINTSTLASYEGTMNVGATTGTLDCSSRGTNPITAQGAATSYATAGAQTYTAADILSGSIVRDCAGAGRTDTLPTAALLVAAIPNATVGDTIRCYITNGSDAAETITINAGSGGTFDTNLTATARVIPQNGSRIVHIRLTNVTASSEAYAVWF